MIALASASPGAAQWSRPQYENLFAAYAVEDTPMSVYFAILTEAESGEVVAWLVARCIRQEWELENIVVAQESRRRGVGSGLLEAFLAHARESQAEAIFLEARESSHAARRLYCRAGFREVGLRRRYYKDPIEDAVLFRLSFC
jgi:ribosomal-protein-alanine N-acetyltransferase